LKRRWKIAIGAAVVLAALLILNTFALNNQTKNAAVTIDGGQILELPGGDVQVLEEGPANGDENAAPIVLLHCYSCSLHWFDHLAPLLAETHRVIRIDLLGFGGSEKPESGYSMEEQAALVGNAMNRLDVEGAVVVGHSMGFDIAVALAQQSSELVDRLVDIDEAVDNELVDIPFLGQLAYVPVLGQAIWRLTPDFAIEDGVSVAFAPDFDIPSGFDNPDQVVDDFRAMTYTSFDEAASENEAFSDEVPLDERVTDAGVPLLAIFGSESQIWSDPAAVAAGYEDVPAVQIEIIDGAGHSPNVEKPEETAALILDFAARATVAPAESSDAGSPNPPAGPPTEQRTRPEDPGAPRSGPEASE
jgi:pimeloyl-ACP methyl ester carboxylesterase